MLTTQVCPPGADLAAPPAADADPRAAAVAALSAREALWPLLPCHPCRACRLPRPPHETRGHATCFRCRQLRERYGDALAALLPVTLTMRDWPLGAALRRFKDVFAAAPTERCAYELGAVLSLFLEARLATASRAPAQDTLLVTTVPSSRPVVAAALERAGGEGWWRPPLTMVACARPGWPSQRDRAGHERIRVAGKWEVDAAAVRDRAVLVLDDLYTTGGTVHSFALALREAGARRVRAVVLGLNVGEAGTWIRPALRARAAAGVTWTPHPSLGELCRR